MRNPACVRAAVAYGETLSATDMLLPGHTFETCADIDIQLRANELAYFAATLSDAFAVIIRHTDRHAPPGLQFPRGRKHRIAALAEKWQGLMTEAEGTAREIQRLAPDGQTRVAAEQAAIVAAEGGTSQYGTTNL